MTINLPLKEFVKMSLEDICRAVEEVREGRPYVALKHSAIPEQAKETIIEFDVAVSVSEVTGASSSNGADVKGKLGINVFGIGTKIQEQSRETSETNFAALSRVKFSVPVMFGFDENAHREMQERWSRPMRQAKVNYDLYGE